MALGLAFDFPGKTREKGPVAPFFSEMIPLFAPSLHLLPSPKSHSLPYRSLPPSPT